MKLPTNIERSAARKGEYVGYAQGKVWTIRKENDGYWCARTAVDTPDFRVHNAKTLATLAYYMED